MINDEMIIIYLSKVLNENGSIEIFFEKLNYWEEFDLIVDYLKENGCKVSENRESIYIRECILEKSNIVFMLKHDGMIGKFLFSSNNENLIFLEKLSANVIENLKLKLKQSKIT